jgi:hypothetical protein
MVSFILGGLFDEMTMGDRKTTITERGKFLASIGGLIFIFLFFASIICIILKFFLF